MTDMAFRCCESRRTTYGCGHPHIEVVILDEFHTVLADHIPPRQELTRPDEQCPECVSKHRAGARNPRKAPINQSRPSDTPEIPDARLHQFTVQAIPAQKFDPTKKSLLIKNPESQALKQRGSLDANEGNPKESGILAPMNLHWTEDFETGVQVRRRRTEESRARRERDREQAATLRANKKRKTSSSHAEISQNRNGSSSLAARSVNNGGRRIVSDYSKRQRAKTEELLRQNAILAQSSSSGQVPSQVQHLSGPDDFTFDPLAEYHMQPDFVGSFESTFRRSQLVPATAFGNLGPLPKFKTEAQVQGSSGVDAAIQGHNNDIFEFGGFEGIGNTPVFGQRPNQVDSIRSEGVPYQPASMSFPGDSQLMTTASSGRADMTIGDQGIEQLQHTNVQPGLSSSLDKAVDALGTADGLGNRKSSAPSGDKFDRGRPDYPPMVNGQPLPNDPTAANPIQTRCLRQPLVQESRDSTSAVVHQSEDQMTASRWPEDYDVSFEPHNNLTMAAWGQANEQHPLETAQNDLDESAWASLPLPGLQQHEPCPAQDMPAQFDSGLSMAPVGILAIELQEPMHRAVGENFELEPDDLSFDLDVLEDATFHGRQLEVEDSQDLTNINEKQMMAPVAVRAGALNLLDAPDPASSQHQGVFDEDGQLLDQAQEQQDTPWVNSQEGMIESPLDLSVNTNNWPDLNEPVPAGPDDFDGGFFDEATFHDDRFLDAGLDSVIDGEDQATLGQIDLSVFDVENLRDAFVDRGIRS